MSEGSSPVAALRRTSSTIRAPYSSFSSAQDRPPDSSYGAMVRILKVPPPSAGRRVGSTAVWLTTSSHGSSASHSPAAHRSRWRTTPSAVPRPAAALGRPAGPKPRSPRSAACTASTLRPGRQVSFARTRSAVGDLPSSIAGSVVMCPPATTARRARITSPPATRTLVARSPSVPTPVTGAPQTTRPPCFSRLRTSALGSAWLPPTGVVQPKSSRPAASDDGRNPVPGRRGSWTVAMASQSMKERTTGCANRSCTTSQALRRRRSR